MSESDRPPVDVVAAATQADSASRLTAAVEAMPVRRVPIAEITGDLSARTGGLDSRHVDRLAGAEGPLPPILLHRSTMRVLDGVHRLAVVRRLRKSFIRARFVDENEADAFVVGVRSNIDDGLELNVADRKRAAGRIVRSHPWWSDRRIALATGLAARTIAAVRHTAGNITSHRLGQDGRVRPVSSVTGRRRAAEIALAEPDLSLRQIARAAGISPETVRDVRAKLQPSDAATAPRQFPADAAGPRQSELPAPTADGSHSGAAARATGGPPDPQARLAALQTLRRDPVLRLSESGRMLLRLLDLHAISASKWQQIAEGVPAHAVDVIAEAARACAAMWGNLARRLHSTQTAPNQGPENDNM